MENEHRASMQSRVLSFSHAVALYLLVWHLTLHSVMAYLVVDYETLKWPANSVNRAFTQLTKDTRGLNGLSWACSFLYHCPARNIPESAHQLHKAAGRHMKPMWELPKPRLAQLLSRDPARLSQLEDLWGKSLSCHRPLQFWLCVMQHDCGSR